MAQDFGTNKLRDDIVRMESKFDIGSYTHKSDAFKFASELPGVEDLIGVIENIVGEVTGFINTLLKALNDLLEWLNLNNIFDALGLNKLLEFIFGLVDFASNTFGLPIDIKNGLLNFFKEACIEVDSDVYTRDNIEQFALASLLIAFACSGYEKTFSTTLDLYMNTPTLTTLRDERDTLSSERAIIKDVPEYVYNEEINAYEPTVTNSKVIPYDEQIASLDKQIEDEEYKVNVLFASTVPHIFTTNTKKETPTNQTVSSVNDIASTSAGRLYGETHRGITSSITESLDKNGEALTTTQTETELRTGSGGLLIGRDSLHTLKEPSVVEMKPEEFETFENSLLVLDPSLSEQDYHNSSTLKGMKIASLNDKELETLEPGSTIDTLQYCI